MLQGRAGCSSLWLVSGGEHARYCQAWEWAGSPSSPEVAQGLDGGGEPRGLSLCLHREIHCVLHPQPMAARLLGCSGDWDKEDAKEDAFLRSGWRYKERPQLPMANLTEGTTDYYLYPGHHLYHPRTGLKVDERALRNTLAEAQPKRKMKEREERQQKSQEIKKSARPIYWHMQRLDRHLKE